MFSRYALSLCLFFLVSYAFPTNTLRTRDYYAGIISKQVLDIEQTSVFDRKELIEIRKFRDEILSDFQLLPVCSSDSNRKPVWSSLIPVDCGDMRWSSTQDPFVLDFIFYNRLADIVDSTHSLLGECENENPTINPSIHHLTENFSNRCVLSGQNLTGISGAHLYRGTLPTPPRSNRPPLSPGFSSHEYHQLVFIIKNQVVQ